MVPLLPTHLVVRIVVASVAAVILSIVVASVWTIYSQTSLVREEQQRTAHVLAEGLANSVASALILRDYGPIEDHLRLALSLPDVRSALVTDLSGRVLGHLRHDPDGPVYLAFQPRTLPPPEDGGAVPADESVANGILTIWHVVKVGTAVGWVRMELATESAEQLIGRMRSVTVWLGLMAALIGLGVLGETAHRTVRYLRHRQSEIEEHHGQLETIAYHDPLTGLANRSLLPDRMRQAIARSDRDGTLLAICFVDLDGFKEVNDRYGHAIGDAMLVEVARRLGRSVRGSDTVVRFGGDEFVVLLGELESREECGRALERLRDSLNEPMRLSGLTFTVSASIGATIYPLDHADAERLIHHADEAMYEAKQAGRNRYRMFS